MVWIVFKCQSLAVMVKPAATSIQIGVRRTTGAMRCIFVGKSFCPEFSVRLQLIDFPNPKFTALKVRTSPQRIFDFCLRQNKSGGRFLALRSVDGFNLFGFGGNVGIEET